MIGNLQEIFKDFCFKNLRTFASEIYVLLLRKFHQKIQDRRNKTSSALPRNVQDRCPQFSGSSTPAPLRCSQRRLQHAKNSLQDALCLLYRRLYILIIQNSKPPVQEALCGTPCTPDFSKQSTTGTKHNPALG